MKGFFYTLLLTSVCGAVCSMLASGGYERYIKYIASLVCLCVMISPLKDINISALADFEYTESEYNTDISKGLYPLASQITEQRAEEYITEIVLSEFGIKPKGCDIKIDWDMDEPIIEDIILTFEKQDINARETVKEYLADVLGGEVEIIEG